MLNRLIYLLSRVTDEQNSSGINSKKESPASYREKYLSLLLEKIKDPLHERIIKAYAKEDSVASMESELGLILTEILNRED